MPGTPNMLEFLQEQAAKRAAKAEHAKQDVPNSTEPVS